MHVRRNALISTAIVALSAETETGSDISISSRGQTLAAIDTLVAEGDKEISDFVGSLIDKNNEVKAGPVTTMLQLIEIYGEDLQEAGFPRPVADEKEEEGTNGPREFFKAPKMNKKGEMKDTNCNFFTEFWADTSKGKAQQFQLDQIALLGTNDEAKAELKFRNMSREKAENLKKKLQNDKSKGRSLIRDGVACWYVEHDLKDYADRCSLELDTDDQEMLSGSQYPYNLVDNTRKRIYRPMSVGDVKKLDVAMAVADAGANGNLYDKLVAQLSRDTGGNNGEKSLFKDSDEMYNAALSFLNWFDTDTDEGKEHYKFLNKAFSKKGSDQAVKTWGDFVSAIKATWNPALETRYRRIIEKEIETADLDETNEANAA